MTGRSTQISVDDPPGREAWVVGIGLVLIALVYRYSWIPGSWETLLRDIETSIGLPVSGVGRWFSAWAAGDGQAFAVIAVDPLGLDQGWVLMDPAYRYGRAGFGWLAWAASLGQHAWVPYGMATVGAVSVAVLFFLAQRLHPLLGMRSWLMVLNPAVFIAFAGDTAESLAMLALAWSLASGQAWASAALGTIRPTFGVALIGRWRMFIWAAAAAVIFGGLWILRFGFDWGQYGGRLGPPLVGYFDDLSLQSALLGAFAVLTLVRGLRHRDWAWMASAVFILCFREDVLGAGHNAWRAAGMLFVLWAFGPGYSIAVGRRVLFRRRSEAAMET
jgi:hypothetical protein